MTGIDFFTPFPARNAFALAGRVTQLRILQEIQEQRSACTQVQGGRRALANPLISEVEGDRTHGRAPLPCTRLNPGGVGVGLALPSSGPAEMRGRQAVPLRWGTITGLGALK